MALNNLFLVIALGIGWYLKTPGGVALLGFSVTQPTRALSLSLFPHSSPKDTLGGGFDATQAFVGELAHFNIWDRKLTPGEVYNLATCSSKALSGNVIAWAESQIEIFGGATKWTFEACRQIN